MYRMRLFAGYVFFVTLVFAVAFVPGCSKDSDSGTGPVTTTITVSGRVVSSLLRPVANAPVVITGLPSTTSNANGEFTIAGVTPPYDITVVISSNKLGITYRGLTRSDPTLVNFFSSTPLTNSATISGTVSGGAGYPLPANHTSRVAYDSPEVSGYSSPNSITGGYTLGLSWNGNTTANGDLHALQWQANAAGMPQAYTGYATKAGVTISNGGSFPNQNLPLASVTAGTISGTITVPSTVTLGVKSLYLEVSSDLAILLGQESGATAAFTYAVPNIANTTMRVAAMGSGASGGFSTALKTGISAGATGVSVTLPEVPQLSLPVDAATNISNTTPFSWTTSASVVYLALFAGPGGEPNYVVITGASTATIPDLTSLGLGLPSSMSYSWVVYIFGPHASIDAAAGANGIVPDGDGVTAFSSSRTFTTEP